MPLNLSHIAHDEATVEVSWGGDITTVKYRPSQYTQENFELLGTDADHDMGWFIGLMVIDWDLVDGPKTKPKKVPLTPAGIKKLPIPFQGAITGAIMSDTKSAEGEAQTSDAG